ncbi:CDP-glycerol glycerophosphotransferase family protein [Spongiactinospora sp. TRM90649]|uniref:CDP-glycerol glycerophosphotransferase family protein n=1 Tax=Spongiactinospora sp. TRM90649 TaxID=3031114 RepID=UPI0023F6B70A|nr:CDP-glycerol glycerophosphotransferase family protein [Spongiactinospora sp. TRM90649]MDF5755515.1 CDP-glycerol glycerophosphotransferase family protein [Spongiactinospora sp. TRM90649]
MATGATPERASRDLGDRIRAVQDLCDRGEPLEAVMAAVREEGLSAADRRRLDAEALAGPLGARIDTAIRRGTARRREMLTLLTPYLGTVDPAVKRALPVARRVVLHLIESRELAELAEGDALTKVVAAAAEPYRRVRKGLRWYADLPLRGELPDELYRLRQADLVPVTQIDDISWIDGRLRVTGHAYLAGLSVRGRRFNRATVVLRGPRWQPSVRLRTRRTFRPEATYGAHELGCNYDWSGFTAELRPWTLRWRSWLRGVARGGRRLLRRRPAVRDTTTWRAEIVIWSRGARAVGLLRGPALGRTERPQGLEVRPRWWVRPVWTSDRALQVVLQPYRAELTGVSLDGDDARLRVFLPGRQVNKGHVRLGGHRMSADFTPVASGTEVAFALSTQSLLAEKDGRRLWVEPKGDPAATVMLGAAEEFRGAIGDREITVLSDRRDRVVVSAHRIRPVITGASWSADGAALVLEGRYPDPGAEERALTLRHRTGLTYRMPLSRDGDRFTVRLDAAAMPRFGEPVPLMSGTWHLSVFHPTARESVPFRVDHQALAALDEAPRVHDGRRYQFVSTRYDVPVLIAAEEKPDDEKGMAGVYALERQFYPAQRREPLREATVYVAYDGRQYEGNVRAVYEERLRRGDGGEHIWVVKDGAFVPPGPAELGYGPGERPSVVRAGSREHYAALARSRYVVTNSFLPPWFRARDDQTIVQTWHGTPVKRVGNDLPHMSRDPRPPVWHRQAAEVRGWDLLLSQSPWATPVLRKAFGYQGEVLEGGYPRNDVLVAPERDELAAGVRRRLGLAEDAKVVLYAPTYRDYDRKNTSLRLNLVQARTILGEGHELLIRAHSMQAAPVVPDDGFSHDVTTYPDITDLLLITDVLITDYSSVMFDFAATGRPMIFFAYDLDRFAAKRGVYLDIAEEAPGPVLATSAQVIQAVKGIDGIAAEYAERYENFRRAYAPRDDGKATRRLVDHVFG